jgi:hypothetical protein
MPHHRHWACCGRRSNRPVGSCGACQRKGVACRAAHNVDHNPDSLCWIGAAGRHNAEVARDAPVGSGVAARARI